MASMGQSTGQVRQAEDVGAIPTEGVGHIAVIAIEGERSQEALRSASDEVRNSEARLRKIIDTIPTHAWCTLPDGTGIFWNRRWLEYTGLSLEVLRGLGLAEGHSPGGLEENNR
jgi:PAS domain-containing protein